MPVVTYDVPGISCSGCANAIQRAVASLTGVNHVHVDVDNKRVTVDYNEPDVTEGNVRGRIEDAGYEVRPASSGRAKSIGEVA